MQIINNDDDEFRLQIRKKAEHRLDRSYARKVEIVYRSTIRILEDRYTADAPGSVLEMEKIIDAEVRKIEDRLSPEQKAMDDLESESFAQWVACFLVLVMGYSSNEAAEELGRSASVVRTNLSKGSRFIKGRLSSLEESDESQKDRNGGAAG